MRVNNLHKVITRQKSGAAGLEPATYTDPETDTLTTQPHNYIIVRISIVA